MLKILLIVSCFFIPVDIYVIGNWMGAGVQFALFRIQVGIGWSYISLFRDIEFVIRGILMGRSASAISLWAVATLFLAFALFLCLFREDIWKSGSDGSQGAQKFIGISILVSAGLFLCSMVAQYGPFFHGASGFTIPIGIPIMVFTGYFVYQQASRDSTVPPVGKIPHLHPWKHQLTNSRIIFALICFIVLFGMLNLILYLYPDSGGDFAIYCSAVELWRHHENPFDMGKITQVLHHYIDIVQPYPGSYFYPPITLLFFAPICDTLRPIHTFQIYYPVYFLVLLMSCFVASRFCLPEKDRLLLYTLLVAGFTSLSWSFSTGNISILYLLFISLVFYFLIKKRYYASSLCMGLMAVFNIFPIVFSSLYVFVDECRKEKIKIISISVIILLASLGLSYLIFPTFFNFYATQFLGETSPIYEAGGYKTPTAYLFLRDMADLFIGKNTPIPYVLDLLFVCAILIIFYSFYRNTRRESLRIFSFGLITIFLLIPRLKPNYFIFILIPIYLLVLNERDSIKTLVVTISAIIPFICLLAIDFLRLERLSTGLISLTIHYNQILCVLAVFIVISWVQRGKGSRKKLPEADEGDEPGFP